MPRLTGGEWLSIKEASEYLGLTNRTLYRLMDQGELPAYKFGRVFRLRRAELDAFIEAHRVKPGDLKHLYPARDDDRSDAR